MTLLAPKPFRGTTIREVLQYLQIDTAKAFANVFTVLGKIKLDEKFVQSRVSELASFGASGTAEDITQITLDAGTWNIFGSAQFYDNGATGTTYGQVWIGTKSADSEGTTYGQSKTEVAISNVAPWFQATCFRRVTLAARKTIYLGSLAVYTGGPIQRLGSIWAIGRG